MDRVAALKDTFSRNTSVPSPASLHSSSSGHIKETVDVDVLPPPTPEWRETCITIKEKLYYSLLNGSFSDGIISLNWQIQVFFQILVECRRILFKITRFFAMQSNS